jgi:hypothetical protein
MHENGPIPNYSSVLMRKAPYRGALGSVALAMVVACSACGSSSPSVSVLRQKVSTIFANTDAALAKDAKAKTIPLVYSDFSKDFDRAAADIQALQFPASMASDADTLVADLHTLGRDATGLSKAEEKSQTNLVDIRAMGVANQKLVKEEKAEKIASDTLRHDLGLPPVPTTTTPPPPPAVLNSP